MLSVISNPSSFHEEALFQRVCANCGAGGAFDSHHVVSKQVLKRLGPIGVERLWAPENALRLCAANRCHERVTNGVLRLDTAILTDQNICFVWETLMLAGQNYLERFYTGPDRRFSLHYEGKCELCQSVRG